MRILSLTACIVAAASALAEAQTPPTLHVRDAIALALERSPDLQPREDAILTAQLAERSAAAPFDLHWTPALTAGSNPGGYDSRVAGVTVSKQLPTGAGVWMSGSSSSFDSGLSSYRDNGYAIGFNTPLATMFAPVAAHPLALARSATASAQRQRDEARQQLVVSTAEAYFDVVRAGRLVEAGERAADRAARLVRASKARAAAGLDTALDVMRAELLASQNDASLADHREALAAARERLNLTIGRPVEDEYDVSADDVAWLERGTAIDGDPVAAALSRRVAVRDARAHVDDAKKTLSVAHWNLLPPVSLNVEYDRHGLGSVQQPYYSALNGWHVSLSSSYALDRTAATTAAASAEIAVRAAERDEAEAERRVTAEVRQAARAVVRADLAADLQHKSLDVAQRQLTLAQLRYERGLADNFAVIDAENTLFQTESASIAAEIDRTLTRLRLQRVTGTIELRRFER